MNLVVDEGRFDDLQLRLLQEIVESIRDGLREAGLKDEDAIFDATGDMAFSIAAIIDGSRIMEHEGSEVVPILTFAKERDGTEFICAKSGGSWMHEYVFGVVDEVFESRDEEGDEDGSES